MTERVFVDTNVLVCAHDLDAGRKRALVKAWENFRQQQPAGTPARPDRSGTRLGTRVPRGGSLLSRARPLTVGHRPPWIPTYQVLAHLPGYGTVIGQLLKSSAFCRSSLAFGGCFQDPTRIDGDFRARFVEPLSALLDVPLEPRTSFGHSFSQPSTGAAAVRCHPTARSMPRRASRPRRAA